MLCRCEFKEVDVPQACLLKPNKTTYARYPVHVSAVLLYPMVSGCWRRLQNSQQAQVSHRCQGGVPARAEERVQTGDNTCLCNDIITTFPDLGLWPRVFTLSYGHVSLPCRMATCLYIELWPRVFT